MPSIDIYAILSSKPHNPHYLKKYLNFIEKCKLANLDLQKDTYLENHHICPKAIDLFPEYTDLRNNPWNSCSLTARQHILAHIILWKCFGGSQLTALFYILNVQNQETGYNFRKIPSSITIRYAAKTREEYFKSRIGYGNYKDTNGTIFWLHRDDPKISELGLVGHVSGRKHDEDTRKRMSDSKLKNREVTMTFLDLTRDVPLFSSDYDDHILQGWIPTIDDGSPVNHICEEDKEYRKIDRYESLSEKLKGRADYRYPNGEYYGKLYSDDPAIADLGLVTSSSLSESVKSAALENQKKAVEANTGSNWYNDGKINKKFKSDPGGEWVLGALIEDSAKEARAEGLRQSRSNTKCYNDGERNYYVKEGDNINPEWKLGMAPQKARKKVDYSGAEIWNDGVKNYRIFPGDRVDPSWNKGMVKGTKKKMRYSNGIDIIYVYSGDEIPAGYKKATKDQINSLPDQSK